MSASKTKDILALQMAANDADAKTVGEYLSKLLVKVLEEDEGFDGKRPFGNSGWTSDIEDALDDGGFTWLELLEAVKDHSDVGGANLVITIDESAITARIQEYLDNWIKQQTDALITVFEEADEEDSADDIRSHVFEALGISEVAA